MYKLIFGLILLTVSHSYAVISHQAIAELRAEAANLPAAVRSIGDHMLRMYAAETSAEKFQGLTWSFDLSLYSLKDAPGSPIEVRANAQFISNHGHGDTLFTDTEERMAMNPAPAVSNMDLPTIRALLTFAGNIMNARREGGLPTPQVNNCKCEIFGHNSIDMQALHQWAQRNTDMIKRAGLCSGRLAIKVTRKD